MPERDGVSHLTSDGRSARPWIGVHFTCAGAYVRVFRSQDDRQYLARCPKCSRCTRFRVGQGGLNHRFFEVSC